MITSIILVSLLTVFMLSCSEQSQVEPATLASVKPDTLNIGCLSAYESNPYQAGDTINRIYGKDRIRHGHWIITEMELIKHPCRHLTTQTRTEGYYYKNKKTGLWKTFNERGALVDSVRF